MEMIDELLEYLINNTAITRSQLRLGYLDPNVENLYGFFLNGTSVVSQFYDKSKVQGASLTVTIKGNQNDRESREFARLLLDELIAIDVLDLATFRIVDINSVSEFQFLGIDANKIRSYSITYEIKYIKL